VKVDEVISSPSGAETIRTDEVITNQVRRRQVMLWSQLFLRFSTIFGRKNLAFFSKTNVVINFSHNLALF
jgi:hypothetical protein